VNCVLVDTNVFVSALVFGGKPAIALQMIEALGIEIAISAELESELVETLRDKFGWSAERVNEARDRLWRNARHVVPAPLAGVVRDPGDDHVVAAALASGASLIVTGDKDLLSLSQFRGIRIVAPSTFIELFKI
jgi:putative PIN family toxin of toxin-antitoxin system